MSNDSANLSIDFMVGFTIFIIAFIWVVSMVPGLLVNLQGYTIDNDAVAYRTGVILVEDPGEPDAWHVADYKSEWNKEYVQRFGLAVSSDNPNILSLDKVHRFFNDPRFVSEDYKAKAIFGEYPYRFNIKITEIETPGAPVDIGSIGDPVPEGYGYIRRFVKIKSPSSAELTGGTAGYVNDNPSEDVTSHMFAIVLDNEKLTGTESTIKDPAYQIIPGEESFTIDLTNLKANLWPDRIECFDIMMRPGDVTIYSLSDPDGFSTNLDSTIVDLPSTLQPVYDLSIHYDASVDHPELQELDWTGGVFINLHFQLQKKPDTDELKCSELPAGSRFLNTTFDITGKPVNRFFSYDYSTDRVNQPQLSDAMVEVAVW